LKAYVYADGHLLARQEDNAVVWQYQPPLDINEWETNSTGVVLNHAELDPIGANFDT